MIVFFDFDDVLFDRDKFIQALIKRFFGEEKKFLETYKKYFKDKGEEYSLKKHLKILGLDCREDEYNLFFRDLSEFVYPRAGQVLSWTRNKTEEIILLSRGDAEFQGKKIKGSGLKDFFKKIVVTKNKLRYLKSRDITEGKDVFFVNDDLGENREIKKFFPYFKIAESLDSFEKIIKKI